MLPATVDGTVTPVGGSSVAVDADPVPLPCAVKYAPSRDPDAEHGNDASEAYEELSEPGSAGPTQAQSSQNSTTTPL